MRTYAVENVRPNTDDYERTHKIGKNVVNYVQLEGGEFPAGSPWNASEAVFRRAFTLALFGPASEKAGVATLDEDVRNTSVVSHEFNKVLGIGRGGQSWGGLWRLAEREPDFPMAMYATEAFEGLYGDIDEALEWIEEHYGKKHQLLPIFHRVLELVRDARQSASKQS